MAIYHFSVKTISRGAGRSAVACSAYRSGEKLEDYYQGKTQDYTKKSGIESKKIYAPENTKLELLERQKLWNAVEQFERRKDATLAREFEIAFPYEFNAEQRQALLDELCLKIVEKHGVIVDACIHAPHTESGSDEKNFHAHIMFTSRQIDPQTGDFAKKKNRDFNKEQSSETVSHWRELFADLTNSHLEKHDFKVRVDHRSYQDQESSLKPTQHEGVAVTALRRQYENNQEKPLWEQNLEIVMPKIALENDAIKALNTETIENEKIIKGLEQEILLSEMFIKDLISEEQIQKIEKQKEKEQDIKQASQHYFNEVFNAITEAQKLRAEVEKHTYDYENSDNYDFSVDTTALNHRAYVAHQKMIELADRYSNYAKENNFLTLRDRTIQYLDRKRQEKKDLGMMAHFTKSKELKSINDSIERITDLFNYFSDMAKDLKQNPFMKSIEHDFFRREKEIRDEKKYKESFQERFEAYQKRGAELRKQLEIDEKRRFNENQLRYKKETEEYHAKKAQKQEQKPDEPQPTDRGNDFER